ncbi:hypothetical protein [Arthrobacter sp. Y-9]|uniref:hypothetical protein n=1 Tax=Arthrobacter sp. Y-9 TaxID=3039385 RepID=UPI00241D6942|nr:hypothetical protein [Arthrobacter sp. Y-9]WFR84504.1 hypothetical protein P9849_02335 [Arthrobacter sp. Y-9]
MHRLKLIAVVIALVAALTACAGATKNDDAAAARKLHDAVASLPHVSSVSSTFTSNAGMGRTGTVDITADTSDDAALKALLRQAFPAIVKAADGDPEASLTILVTAADGSGSLSPTALGYSGGNTLTSYRDFLRAHPDLSSAG